MEASKERDILLPIATENQVFSFAGILGPTLTGV
jgi:hypothetical protein